MEAKEQEFKVGKYFPQTNYIITGYLYVEAKKNNDGEYKKDYKFGNGDRIQYNVTQDIKHTLALTAQIELDSKTKRKYTTGQFYNAKDDGREFIVKNIDEAIKLKEGLQSEN